MRRHTTLAVAIALAICAGVLPLLVAFNISRERALALEGEHLADYAGWTVQRADLNIARARTALEQMASEHLGSCSPDEIVRLQQLTTDALSVEEIAITSSGRLVCNTWGPARSELRVSGKSIPLSDGYTLRLDGDGLSDPASGLVVLSRGDYHALLKRERLVDVLRDTPMVLSVASLDGQAIVYSGDVDATLVSRLAGKEASGFDDRQVFASRRGKDFAAVAISDRDLVEWRTDRELWKIVPIGLGISIALIALIVWALRQRLSLAGELATGIQRREFVAHYQPIIELTTGRCVGAEALIRWRKPDGTWVRPDVFIPLAEQHGMISAITAIMIRNVMAEMNRALVDHRDMHIAINISAADIERGEFLTLITDEIGKCAIDAAQIWLEVTERGFINPDIARSVLMRARDAGHVVAIDDFGTGYSSLSLLETLPVTVLKIDKSFVDAIGKNAATSLVTPHIIKMAHSLEFDMVAEGVERPEQETYLRQAGVQFGQGWLYAKALPAKEFVAFYQERNGMAKALPAMTLR